jgi:ABC-type multidrug transport system ATPase subunit
MSYSWGQDKPLFEHLDITISANKSILLTGDNGAGKSTLLRLIIGALQPNSGSITYNEIDTYRPQCPLFAEAFYLSQNTTENLVGISPFEDLSIWLMAQPPIVERHELEPLLDSFGVADLAHQPIAHLSTGEKRLVSLCMLPQLMHKYWILDEPFAGLDAINRKRLLELIIAKQKLHRGLILVSHDVDTLTHLMDETWEIRDRSLSRSL